MIGIVDAGEVIWHEGARRVLCTKMDYNCNRYQAQELMPVAVGEVWKTMPGGLTHSRSAALMMAKGEV